MDVQELVAQATIERLDQLRPSDTRIAALDVPLQLPSATLCNFTSPSHHSPGSDGNNVLRNYIQMNPTFPAHAVDTLAEPKRWLGFVALALLVLVFLWLPFGLRLIGLIEEWDILGLFTNAGTFYFADASSPLPVSVLRPLVAFPHAVAYRMDPDSFVYWHVLMVGSLCVKGFAVMLLGKSITNSNKWGALLGLLVLLYPADTMQLSLRSIHINVSLACLLLAAALTVQAWNSKQGLSTLLLVLVSSLLLGVSILMYEVAMALLPLPFVMLYVRVGGQATLFTVRSKPLVSVGWVGVALLYVAYVLIVPRGPVEYHQSIFQGRPPFAILMDAAPKLLNIGMVRALAGGWVDAWRMLWSEFEFRGYAYLMFASCVCAASVYLFSRELRKLQPESNRAGERVRGFLLRLSIMGLVLAACGYVPYLFSNAHTLITQRTYLFASPGAAMFVLALLIGLERLSSKTCAAAQLTLIVLGFGAQLYQFHHYVTLADAQRSALRNIVENFDGKIGNKTLLVIDYSNRFAHTWFLRDNLIWALSYVYGHPINKVEICLMPNADWQRLDSTGRAGTCRKEAHQWILSPPVLVRGPGPSVTKSAGLESALSDSEVVTLVIPANGVSEPAADLETYRQHLRSGVDHAARRYQRILAESATSWGSALFRDTQVSTRYRWDFGKWWSLDQPTRGSGWREPVWSGAFFHHNAAAWKSQGQSSLVFDLSPLKAPYVLEGEFSIILNDDIRSSMRIRLNDVDLPYRWQGGPASGGRFEVEVSSDLLTKGVNTVEFNSHTDSSNYGLSAELDWFEIRPR